MFDEQLATPRSAALKQGAAGGPWHPYLAAVEIPENQHFRRHRSLTQPKAPESAVADS